MTTLWDDGRTRDIFYRFKSLDVTLIFDGELWICCLESNSIRTARIVSEHTQNFPTQLGAVSDNFFNFPQQLIPVPRRDWLQEGRKGDTVWTLSLCLFCHSWQNYFSYFVKSWHYTFFSGVLVTITMSCVRQAFDEKIHLHFVKK